MADNRLSTFLPDDRASFGIFPQMKPRRRFQDPVGAANVPLDVTRGRVAGLAGLLPDVLNFMGRSPMPTEQFGETQYEPAQQLPYGSEYFLQNLPLKPTSRIGEVAGQAGAFVPLNPMPAARAVAAGAKALGPTAVGMGERYLQRQGLMPAVVPAATPLASMIDKPQAPVSPIGFYSAAEQAALALPRKSGTGESFLNDLMKGQDVKKDELSWMGLDDYLKGKPNVTRQEVQDFIASNRVDVQERQLGAAVAEDPVGIAQRKAVFDKYDPQIQGLYKEIDQYETNTINARNLASKNETEAIAALNREGNPQPIPTTDDWNRYYAAKAEMERVNKIPLDSREYVRKLDELVRARDAEANAAYVIPESTPTRYQNYQLPGGENYREILLKLPSSKTSMEEFLNVVGKKYGGNTPRTQWSPEDNAMYEKLLQEERTPIQPEYRSSHFSDPNILAHMRVNDRVDADGKKMLLVEEIQSDWHQAGREKGYQRKDLTPNQIELKYIAPNIPEGQNPANYPGYYEAFDKNTGEFIGRHSGSLNQEQAMRDAVSSANQFKSGVPDAPFKDTWYQLSLKRLLKYAADNGYDRVGLTTGSQQAKRYDLSKQVDEIAVPMVNSDGSRSVRIEPTEGGNIKLMVDSNGVVTGYGSGSTQFSGKKLNEVLGKEIADKVMNAQANAKFSGLDLQVGGEGMKKYYDEIYPAFLAKQGKKYNAKTGETQIPAGRSNVGGMPSMYPDKETIRYIDISPEMRGGVKKGQPLFTAAPIGGIGLGAGTQDQQQNSINSFIQ